MNNITLNLKEQKLLWMILNQAQNIGVRGASDLIKKNEGQTIINKQLGDWISQTMDEYDTVNKLKVKLCGDLE